MSKRQLIINQAIEIFAKKGFESTSIQEITEQCGISKGAFYLSFKSKDELIISIIDHFMSQLTDDIDRVVNTEQHNEKKIFMFYFSIFQFMEKHRSFALIFAMEQMHHLGKEIFVKMTAYDQQFSIYILQLLEKVYGVAISSIKYDLLLCIKGFIKAYSGLIILQKSPNDITLLSHSLVDKTNSLANHAKIAYISENMFQHLSTTISHTLTMQQIIEEINQLLQGKEDQLESESLRILLDQLQNEMPSQAIIRGMVSNLKQYPRCRLLIYQLEKLLSNTQST